MSSLYVKLVSNFQPWTFVGQWAAKENLAVRQHTKQWWQSEQLKQIAKPENRTRSTKGQIQLNQLQENNVIIWRLEIEPPLPGLKVIKEVR